MKKIYMTPVMETTTINAISMICNSPGSETMGFKGGEATEMGSNERRGIFSNDDAPSYNRNLW